MGWIMKRLLGVRQGNEEPMTGREKRGSSDLEKRTGSDLPDDLWEAEIVGESNYQDSLWRVVGGKKSGEARVRKEVLATLLPETDNKYDSNAVCVWIDGLKVGYLSREDARKHCVVLLNLQRKHGKPVALPAVILGGGDRAGGPGALGVFLRRESEPERADFEGQGRTLRESERATIRTGLSDALATDKADGRYDLSWIEDLPSDDVRAISKLRQLLQDERDPIDRHFMFHHLETALYRCRDVFGSALDEYDAACRQHDLEMDTIRDEFKAKWGKVPLLETYRQMCIRQQKAKNFEEALWWAERGIAFYGTDAFRTEAVDDLRKRAEGYRKKLPVRREDRQ